MVKNGLRGGGGAARIFKRQNFACTLFFSPNILRKIFLDFENGSPTVHKMWMGLAEESISGVQNSAGPFLLPRRRATGQIYKALQLKF